MDWKVEKTLNWINVEKTHWIKQRQWSWEVLNFSNPPLDSLNDSSGGIEKTHRSRKLNELKLSWIKVQKTHWIEVEVLNFSNDSSRGIEKTHWSRKLFEWNTNTRLKLECSHSSWKLQLEDTLFDQEAFIARLKC